MTQHRQMPSEVEPTALDDLIADARHIPLPERRVIDLTDLPRQRSVLTIPDTTISLVDGYADYYGA